MKNESNTARENEINNQAISNPEKYKDEAISRLDENFKNKASEMFKNAKDEKKITEIEKLSYRRVDSEEAATLKDKTGLDLEGYEHNITNMDIRHIYKNHGDEKTENFLGQRAITEKDILLIPEITKNYDDVMLSPKSNKGSEQEVIIYRKKMGDEFLYLETVGGRKNRELRSKSMWIIRKKN